MTQNRTNSTRSKARKRALDILFESDLRQRSARETLAERIGLGEQGGSPVRPFTLELVNGWLDHLDDVDDILAACLAEGWSLDRLNHLDRNIARLGIVEMAHTDTPHPVVISEAVNLAAELSTPESPRFVNAVLDAASRRIGAIGQAAPDDEGPEAGEPTAV